MIEAARPAKRDDLAAVVDLAMLAHAELLPTRGGAMWAERESRPLPMDDALAAAIDDQQTLVQVGTIDGTPVGYSVTGVDVMNSGRTVAVLSDLFVHPEARGVGVGECLLDGVIIWAGEQGCDAVDSLALPGNRATKNFFESFGMKARALTVSRSLLDDDA